MLGFSPGWGAWGFLHISLRIGRRLIRRPAHARADVHFFDLATSPLPVVDTRVPVVWETPHDLAAVQERVRTLPEAYRSDIAERLAQRHWCLLGKSEGVVAHAAWAAIGMFKAHWFDRKFRLQPGDAYLYGAYTAPEFRGLRIHPASAIERLRQARACGVRRAYWFVDPNDHAARQLPIRIGAARIGSAGYVEVAGIRVHYLWDFGHLTQSNSRLVIEKR